jgi:hypothetical protein
MYWIVDKMKQMSFQHLLADVFTVQTSQPILRKFRTRQPSSPVVSLLFAASQVAEIQGRQHWKHKHSSVNIQMYLS